MLQGDITKNKNALQGVQNEIENTVNTGLNARSFISTMLAKIFVRDAQDHFLVQTTHFKQIFKAVQNPRGSNWSDRAFPGSRPAEVGPSGV